MIPSRLCIAGAGLGLLWATANLAAQTFVEVSYIGQDKVHLRYQVQLPRVDSGTPEVGQCRSARLQVVDGSGTVTVLDDGKPVTYGPVNFLADGLALGTYTFQVAAEMVVETAPVRFEWRVVAEAPPAWLDGAIGGMEDSMFPGTWRYGTLLFDEVLSPPPDGSQVEVRGGLRVPRGLSLDASGVALTGSGISVAGHFVFDAQTRSTQHIDFETPHNITGARHLALGFGAGAAPSSVSDSSDVAVFLNDLPNMTLSGIENLTLSAERVTNLTITYTGLLDGSTARWDQGGSLTLRHVHGAPADFSIQGAQVAFENCTLGGSIRCFSAEVNATDTLFGKLDLYPGTGATHSLLRCGSTDWIGIYGKGKTTLTDCEFGGSGVMLVNRSDTTIKGCLFHGALRFVNLAGADPPPWYANTKTPMPVIQNNSFVGPVALQYGQSTDPDPVENFVSIGPNYYGSELGLRESDYFPWVYWRPAFLGMPDVHAGAMRDRRPYKIDPPLTSGTRQKRFNRILPAFWLNDWVAGQNAFTPGPDQPDRSGHRMKGRRTLLSLDVLTSDKRVRGVRFYAVVDGQTLETLNPVVLSRDYADTPFTAKLEGRVTVNFALPPTANSRQDFEVYLDPESLTQYPPEARPKDPILILKDHINLSLDPPQRPLSILVIPVGIDWLRSSSGPASTAAVEKYLKDVLPAMLPLRPRDIILTRRAPYVASCQLGWLTTTPLLNWLAAELQWDLDTSLYDFAVAVMPAKSMSVKVHGASLVGRRGVVFVDEAHPSAALHEIGHAMGLYTGTEQYDLFPWSSTDGRVLEQCTIFPPDGVSMHPGFGGGFLMHFPQPTVTWAREHDWRDIMSREDKYVWADPGTFGDMAAWLKSRLYAAPVARKSAHALAAKGVSNPPPPGHHRIQLHALLRSIDGTTASEVIPDSLTIADASLLDLDPNEPSTSGYYKQVHELEGRDAAGNVVYQHTFYIPSMNIEHKDIQAWGATLDIPDTVRTLKVARTWWGWPETGPRELLHIESGGQLSNALAPVALTPGLPGHIQLHWTASASAPGPFVKLWHRVDYRTSPDAPWIPLGKFTRATSLEFDTDFIPLSPTAQFRVVTTDGLTSVETVSSVYQMGARPPRVAITTPVAGWRQTPETSWTLVAAVDSPDDTPISSVSWSSSRDGELGVGTRLFNVPLSAGEHILTCRATDANGLTGEASVDVSVGAVTSFDLALTDDSLGVFVPGRDPLDEGPLLLTPGQAHRLRVRFDGASVDLSGRIRVSVMAPGSDSDWTTLLEQLFEAAAFERVVFNTNFTPEARGLHRFKVEVFVTSPWDPNPANNTRLWSFNTLQPAIELDPLVIHIDRSLMPGQVLPPYQDANIALIHSVGQVPLTVRSLNISGPDAARFSLLAGPAGTTVDPGAFTRVQVRYTPLDRGRAEAVLQIASDDPDHPLVEVPLIARFLDQDQWNDSDGDGLLDIEENAWCTRADSPDTDGDGIPDSVEDANRNGRVDPGETDPCRADTDGDGLTDYQEDDNRNGRWDYGETSGWNADTDGDGIADGAELAAGTGPIEAGDVLRVTAWIGGPTGVVLQWEGRHGRTYRILRSQDLVHWIGAPSGTGPNQQSQQTAFGDGPLTYEDPTADPSRPVFYQVRVEP